MQYWATVFMALSFFFAAPVYSESWVDVFNPKQVLTLNLQMEPAQWDIIRHDITNKIKHPAYFWADGDDTLLLVSVRRKSSRALPSEANPIKVGLKIDINDYVSGQTWRSLRKLSLENGADTSTLLEGFAWYLHRLAWTPAGYPYMPPLASWARVYVNGEYFGVYVNVEQIDKRFLEWQIVNRPRTLDALERVLDPVLGKSLVVYAHKPKDAVVGVSRAA